MNDKLKLKDKLSYKKLLDATFEDVLELRDKSHEVSTQGDLRQAFLKMWQVDLFFGADMAEQIIDEICVMMVEREGSTKGLSRGKKKGFVRRKDKTGAKSFDKMMMEMEAEFELSKKGVVADEIVLSGDEAEGESEAAPNQPSKISSFKIARKGAAEILKSYDTYGGDIEIVRETKAPDVEDPIKNIFGKLEDYRKKQIKAGPKFNKSLLPSKRMRDRYNMIGMPTGDGDDISFNKPTIVSR